MKMNYYKDKATQDVFAYSDTDLNSVSRINELETIIPDKEPIFIEAESQLQQSLSALEKASENLDIAQKTEMPEDEDLRNEFNEKIENLTQEFNAASQQHQNALDAFNAIQSEYQPIKDEYDSILPIFFDIREYLKGLKKMTDKEVQSYLNPPKTKEQHIAEAEQQKQSLLAEANNAIAPLQDAVDLEMATDEEAAALQAWKTYRVLLNRVDTSTAPNIDWPEKPE
ncbi:tail fiber assembly protein [Providencia rettgeri]|uniref:tail fiber assembly protein n=2 Tax=Morganellaceae TaxID=1903414 RepID=UPI00234B7C57|nr:tail fiber assembly protein [Providencia sp. PROV077]